MSLPYFLQCYLYDVRTHTRSDSQSVFLMVCVLLMDSLTEASMQVKSTHRLWVMPCLCHPWQRPGAGIWSNRDRLVIGILSKSGTSSWSRWWFLMENLGKINSRLFVEKHNHNIPQIILHPALSHRLIVVCLPFFRLTSSPQYYLIFRYPTYFGWDW